MKVRTNEASERVTPFIVRQGPQADTYFGAKDTGNSFFWSPVPRRVGNQLPAASCQLPASSSPLSN